MHFLMLNSIQLQMKSNGPIMCTMMADVDVEHIWGHVTFLWGYVWISNEMKKCHKQKSSVVLSKRTYYLKMCERLSRSWVYDGILDWMSPSALRASVGGGGCVMRGSFQSLQAVHHSSCPPHSAQHSLHKMTLDCAWSVYLIILCVFLTSL